MDFNTQRDRSKALLVPPWNILIIDDDLEDYLIVRDRLSGSESKKWSLQWASTFEEGRKLLFGEPHNPTAFDAVLVDYNLGAHTGLEILHEAQRRKISAPFILLAGIDRREIDLEAMQAGAALYLTKEEASSILLERTIRYAIELRQKELALEQSDQKLRHQAMLFDFINDAMISSDAEYRITAWNKAAETLYGWSAAEVIGKNGLDLVRTQFPETDKLRMLDVIAREGQWRGEVTQVKRSGERFPVEVNSIVLYDENHQVTEYLSVNRDITERKRTEETVRQANTILVQQAEKLESQAEELRAQTDELVKANLRLSESDSRFRIALSNPSIAVFTTDEDLRYTWFYSTGMSAFEQLAIGKKDEELFLDGNAAEFSAVKQKVLETRSAAREEIQISIKGRSDLMFFDVSIEPLFDPQGALVGVIGACFDVTEQRTLEEERREHKLQMELHRRLLEYREKERQGIARDLHDGPVQDLSGLLFNIQFTKEAIQDPLMKVELEQIALQVKQTIQDLRGTINELRPPSLIRFGILQAIRLHLEDFQDKHPGILINCEADLQDSDNDFRLPEQVKLTLFRIYQEGMNNIARHSQATQAWVSISRRGDQVILELQDNGKGFSVNTGLADQTERNHFGLAGMTERADAVGGRLNVTSAPGEGTKIVVSIPINPSAQ
jgi:PAS domain S-box-containing protein